MPSAGPELWDEVAGQLRGAEESGRPVAPIIDTWPGFTIADAYGIQRVNIDHRLGAGDTVRGHKVGLSSAAMQRMMGVDEPDFGHLLATMEFPNGGVVDISECIQPRVEVELAFVLGAPLTGPDCTVEDVLAATASVRPAIEIIDSRIVDWHIGIVDTIADNASSKAFVLGDPVELSDRLDVRMVPVVLSVNGEIAETGVSAAVLGNPALAVAWLANTLHPFGVVLEAGHVILPGSCTKAVPVTAGDSVVAEFGALGVVAITFESTETSPSIGVTS